MSDLPPGKCYCVSVPRLRDRRIGFRMAWHFDVEFVLGFDYQTDDLHAICRAEGLSLEAERFRPFVAMFLSHRRLWKHILSAGDELVTIFEDDARPTGELWIPRDEASVYRWYWYDQPDRPRWVGTACYTATRRGIERLLAERLVRSPDQYFRDLGITAIAGSRPVRVSAQPSYVPVEQSSEDQWLH